MLAGDDGMILFAAAATWFSLYPDKMLLEGVIGLGHCSHACGEEMLQAILLISPGENKVLPHDI